MAQLMPLPLTISCFSKIQIGFTFLVPAHPGSPGKKCRYTCVCVCVCIIIIIIIIINKALITVTLKIQQHYRSSLHSQFSSATRYKLVKYRIKENNNNNNKVLNFLGNISTEGQKK